MALVDDIEFYGRAVEAGELTFEEAVQLLVGASAGGLAEGGARCVLADWSTVRAYCIEGFERDTERLAVFRRLL